MRATDGDEVRDMVGSHGARCPDLVTQMGVHPLDTRVPVSLNVTGHWGCYKLNVSSQIGILKL